MSSLKEIQALQLQSEKVFDYFEEICAIPHGSRNTKAISDYLVAFAKKHDLTWYQDESNNVVIVQEATAGYEQADTIILQGHMDMVCEKENGCAIDFEKDGLDLYVDGDFLKARGTTLGGDDGIAVAYALAIMDSPEIAHPRLEVVITVDEEIGMLGAEVIDLSMLKGHKLLNIDSDVEGHFLTSCAGGMTVETTIPVDRMSQNGLAVTLTVTGLCGGHSGSEIDKEHANANMVMGRVLKYVSDRMELGVVTLEGGLKDNAIPRECTAGLLIPEEKKEELTTYIKELTAELKKEYAVSDAGITIDCAFGEKGEASILSYTAMARVIFYLRHVPNGVQHMSTVMPGLVETSLNLGILKLEDQALLATSSVRSSVSSRKEDLRDRLEHIAEFLGGEIAVSGDYPAWEYQAKSEIRDTISAVYEELFLWNVLLNAWILERTRQINCFSYETALYSFRKHRVSGELLARMQEEAEEKGMSEKELLAVYFAEDGSVTDPGQLAVEALYAKRYQPQAYARICGYLSAVWDDLERFPVGTVASDGNAGVSFADSWMQSRNFGGERGHEGCDIMASVNERGIYPIYSVSDGVVENVGWLRLGGYRIGIRSPSGAYFYYAHLAEYAKEFEVGETVLAGTHLGYMGDTGYSDIPGTTGNFPVHLHFGIYINDENGQELSVNPYPMVLYLWEQQGKYTFGETKRQ